MKTEVKTSSNQAPYIYSPFHLKVKNEVGNLAKLGRNSYTLLRLIDFFRNLSQGGETLLEIGSFVESAGNTRILVGGEHRNSRVMNSSVPFLPFVQSVLSDNTLPFCFPFSKGKLSIGSNVVISTSVTILSGLKIGDGAVLGAGAVITKDVPPFSIVAGNPAKVIKYRFDKNIIDSLLDIRWWDFEYSFLMKNFDFIVRSKPDEIIERFKETHLNEYTKEDEFLIFERNADFRVFDGHTRTEGDLIGLEIANQFFSKKNFSTNLRDYFQQLDSNKISVDPSIISTFRENVT